MNNINHNESNNSSDDDIITNDLNNEINDYIKMTVGNSNSKIDGVGGEGGMLMIMIMIITMLMVG